jgi:hypothetical protein
MQNAEITEPAAITWTVPAAWKAVANPSPMRLATIKVSDTMELSVARAGGTVDANVARWGTQFDGAPKIDRTTKSVSGFTVTVVRIGGTFLGMGMGKAPEHHDGWVMLAAIIEAGGPPYFFKMVGPADQIDGARATFDSLIDSIKPAAK